MARVNARLAALLVVLAGRSASAQVGPSGSVSAPAPTVTPTGSSTTVTLAAPAPSAPAVVVPTPMAEPTESVATATVDSGGGTDHSQPLPETRNVTRTKFWAQGPARWFMSSAVDAGYLYLRPRVSFGFGHPFWTWAGIDANPQVSQNWIGAYGGLRFAIPSADLRLGARYVRSFHRAYLTPRDHYDRLQFESRDFSIASYLALEAELSGALPAGPGSLLFVGSVARVSGVPKGLYVFEENLRVIMKPPTVWRGRTGYAVRLGVEGKLSVGVVGEALGSGDRDLVIRAGIIASAVLSNHLEVLGSFVPVIISPDTRTTAGGDFAQLGVRWRWATGVTSEKIVMPVAMPIESDDRR